MNRKERTIFIVDDDSSLCRALGRLMKSAGYRNVHKFTSAEEFLSSVPFESPSLLILDLQLPGMSGVDLLKYLRVYGISLPIVLISAHDEELARAKSMKNPALSFLHKPFDEKELLSVIHSLIPE
ncbi:MAG TPA: response regulator [Deltaproteobacteria bacterium]|nr:response regulator [Deltaproteobacteria bacterium]HQI02337.1 response regulator [Deltaproteobacteria bacterium]HQJ09813.1 response regulator [Deltaproteobacteria bacterium]